MSSPTSGRSSGRQGPGRGAWRLGWLRSVLYALPLLGLVGTNTSCRPEIGDKCTTSTDCSTRGDRLCDTSQPGGYCTQFNCRANTCPEEAACVLFNSAVPGCSYDDRSGPFGSRVARSFCMARCETNADCRRNEGYVCADPRTFPWGAVQLEDDQSLKTCLPVPQELDGGTGPVAPPPVCGPSAPVTPPIDAGEAGIFDGGAPSLFPDAGDASSDGG